MKKYILFFVLMSASVISCMEIDDEKEAEKETQEIEQIRQQIDLGKDHIDSFTNPWGYTKLMQAASFGKLKLVKFLIKNKADLNITNHNEQTALRLAYDRPLIVETLLEARADYNCGETIVEFLGKYKVLGSEENFVLQLIRNAIDKNNMNSK